MKRNILLLVIITAASLLISENSSAQNIGLQGAGGRVSFVDPEGGGGGAIGLGGHVHLGEIIPNLVLHPSLEYWSKSGVSAFTINADVRYYFPTEGNIDFFGGGGIALNFTSVDLGQFGDANSTDLGLNILGGADFPVAENLVATAEIKFLLSDFHAIKITGGITYFFGNN
ncbi:MAG: hypothetical protein ACE5IR_15205 [bacterium]